MMLLLLCLWFFTSNAFLLPVPGRLRSCLSGIHEWRDLEFDFPGNDRRLGAETSGPPKSLCLLPFDYREVLLQGETKQLRLYEERFIKLFADVVENHASTLGMGLLAESGIIQTVPLCEIEAYNRMEGFGIFVTIRVVGRAQLLSITQQEPYLKAVCVELSDTLPVNLELPNLVAGNIENFMLLLSSMEHRLSKASEESPVEDDDSEMQRRIAIAKLDDRFYQDFDEDDDNDDDNAESDGGEDETEWDRRARFRKAYQVALSTDTQGYQVFSQDTGDRSPQELTAISWAAFCTDILAEEAATFRIQALDCDHLFDRLKLASHMLRAKKEQLREKMEKAGLKFRNEDEDIAG